MYMVMSSCITILAIFFEIAPKSLLLIFCIDYLIENPCTMHLPVETDTLLWMALQCSIMRES